MQRRDRLQGVVRRSPLAHIGRGAEHRRGRIQGRGLAVLRRAAQVKAAVALARERQQRRREGERNRERQPRIALGELGHRAPPAFERAALLEAQARIAGRVVEDRLGGLPDGLAGQHEHPAAPARYRDRPHARLGLAGLEVLDQPRAHRRGRDPQAQGGQRLAQLHAVAREQLRRKNPFSALAVAVREAHQLAPPVALQVARLAHHFHRRAELAQHLGAALARQAVHAIIGEHERIGAAVLIATTTGAARRPATLATAPALAAPLARAVRRALRPAGGLCAGRAGVDLGGHDVGQRSAHQLGHAVEPMRGGLVVEVGAAVGQLRRHQHIGAQDLGGALRSLAARILPGARLGLAVIIGRHDPARRRPASGQRARHVGQVAGVERDRHRRAGRLVQRGRRGEALGQHQAGGALGLADPAVQALHPAALRESLRAVGLDRLDRPQIARRIAHRHQEHAGRLEAAAVRLDPLALQVGRAAGGRRTVPALARSARRLGLLALALGLRRRIAFTLCGLGTGARFGVRRGRRRSRARLLGFLFGRVLRRQVEAVRLRLAQQRAHRHAAAFLDAPPDRARLAGTVLVRALAPSVEHVEPGIAVERLQAHRHAHPFLAPDARRDRRERGPHGDVGRLALGQLAFRHQDATFDPGAKLARLTPAARSRASSSKRQANPTILTRTSSPPVRPSIALAQRACKPMGMFRSLLPGLYSISSTPSWAHPGSAARNPQIGHLQNQ